MKKKTNIPTQELVSGLFIYDKDTGIFVWRIDRCKAKAGTRAGYLDTVKGRYWRLRVAGRKFAASRVAWLYVTGEWPLSEVDHIDGNSENDKFLNLRKASRHQQRTNVKQRRDSRHGLKGVKTYRFDPSRFVAEIFVNKKCIYLGIFLTREEAAAAYDRAAIEHFGEFARTNSQLGLI